MRFSFLAVSAALLFSSSVFAQSALQLDVMNKPFSVQKAAVLNAVNSDLKYSEITVEKRTQVATALDRISEILADDKALSSVDAGNRQHVLDDQQLINDTLQQALRDSRMICAKEPVVGSNLPKRICKTAAARNRDSAKVRSNSGKNGTDVSL